MTLGLLPFDPADLIWVETNYWIAPPFNDFSEGIDQFMPRPSTGVLRRAVSRFR
jgi:hypothetical protein